MKNKGKFSPKIIITCVALTLVLIILSIATLFGGSAGRKSVSTASPYKKVYLPFISGETLCYANRYEALCIKGYNEQQSFELLQFFPKDNIDTILKHKYCPVLCDGIKAEYFNFENLERYLAYFERHCSLTAESLLTQVGSNIDKPFYKDATTVSRPDAPNVLVNKYNKLPDDYSPSELVKIPEKYAYKTERLMKREAANAFEAMAKAAEKDKITIMAGSTYRSLAKQQQAYNDYLEVRGRAGADLVAARKGYSEHHTGLAVDICNSAGVMASKDTKMYKWLVENCADFGFILRYLEGKEFITGYSFEPWHYRYVGKDTAKIIMENTLTYEEYSVMQFKYDTPHPDNTAIYNEITECMQNSTPEQAAVRLGISPQSLSMLINYINA